MKWLENASHQDHDRYLDAMPCNVTGVAVP